LEGGAAIAGGQGQTKGRLTISKLKNEHGDAHRRLGKKKQGFMNQTYELYAASGAKKRGRLKTTGKTSGLGLTGLRSWKKNQGLSVQKGITGGEKKRE